MWEIFKFEDSVVATSQNKIIAKGNRELCEGYIGSDGDGFYILRDEENEKCVMAQVKQNKKKIIENGAVLVNYKTKEQILDTVDGIITYLNERCEDGEYRITDFLGALMVMKFDGVVYPRWLKDCFPLRTPFVARNTDKE